MWKVYFAVVGFAGLVAGYVPQEAFVSQPGQGGSTTRSDGAAGSVVGTWRLVSVERRTSKGDPLPPAKPPAFGSPDAVGLMMYDPGGYMGLAIMQSGRQKYAGSEPTAAEAKSAFESFRSFFGTYKVEAATGSLAVHLDGSLDPKLTNTDIRSAFAIAGNRLTLKRRSTGTLPEEELVWERVPDLANLTATHRRLIGFYKLVPNEGDKAGTIPPEQGQRRGFIIYTASGHMAVHIMQGGRAGYAGAEPTPEEAKAALRSYTSYFGPYSVEERERYVVHQRIGHTIPGSIGTNGQRFYEFVGRRLVLRVFSTTFTVPTTMQAAKSEGREPSMITWERISAEAGSPAGNR